MMVSSSQQQNSDEDSQSCCYFKIKLSPSHLMSQEWCGAYSEIKNGGDSTVIHSVFVEHLQHVRCCPQL